MDVAIRCKLTSMLLWPGISRIWLLTNDSLMCQLPSFYSLAHSPLGGVEGQGCHPSQLRTTRAPCFRQRLWRHHFIPPYFHEIIDKTFKPKPTSNKGKGKVVIVEYSKLRLVRGLWGPWVEHFTTSQREDLPRPGSPEPVYSLPEYYDDWKVIIPHNIAEGNPGPETMVLQDSGLPSGG